MSRAVCDEALRAIGGARQGLAPEESIEALREALQVQQIDDALIIEVRLVGAEAHRVADILGAVLDAYLHAADQRREDVNALLNRSSQAFEQNFRAIGSAETALATTLRAQSNRAVGVEGRAPAEIAELQRTLLHEQLEGGRLRAELAMMDEALQQQNPAALVPLASTRLTHLRADKVVAKQLLVSQLASDHPKLKSAEAELDVIAQRIREEVRDRAEELLRQIKVVEQAELELETLLLRIREQTNQREIELLEQERYRREIALRTQVHDLQLTTLAKAKLARTPSWIPRVLEQVRVRERRELAAWLRALTLLSAGASLILLVLRLRASAER